MNLESREDVDVILRRGERGDMESILGLIHELAVYEKIPHGPQLTIGDLIRDGGFIQDDDQDHDQDHDNLDRGDMKEEEGKKKLNFEEPKKWFMTFVAEQSSSSSSSTNHDQDQEEDYNQEDKKIEGKKLIVGFVLFFPSYSTWRGKSLWMEDLFVIPSKRGKGIGRSLFQAVIHHGFTCWNCSRIDFYVLNWNTSSISFYEKMGAKDLTTQGGWHYFRLEKK